MRSDFLKVAAVLAVAVSATGCGGGDARFDSLPRSLATGEGAVWFLVDHGAIFRLDPESNELTEVATSSGGVVRAEGGVVDLEKGRESGSSGEVLAVGEGAIWLLRGDSVARLDPATGDASGSPVVLPSAAYALAVGEGAVWAAGDDGLFRIDPASSEVTTIPVPNEAATDVAVGEGAVWAVGFDVGEAEPDMVVKVDPATNTVVDQIAIGDPGASSVRIATGAGAVWVVQGFGFVGGVGQKNDPGVVYRIDPGSSDVGEGVEVGVGGQPHEIAAGDEGVWVANPDGDQVYRLAPESGEIAEKLEPGTAPHSLTVGFGALWVATGEYQETGDTAEVPDGRGGEILEVKDADVVRIEG